MHIAEDLGITTFPITTSQISSIIMKLLGIDRPYYLPSIDEIDLPTASIDQVILFIIDNFSLFEIITYQPEWMIKNLDNLKNLVQLKLSDNFINIITNLEKLFKLKSLNFIFSGTTNGSSRLITFICIESPFLSPVVSTVKMHFFGGKIFLINNLNADKSNDICYQPISH